MQVLLCSHFSGLRISFLRYEISAESFNALLVDEYVKDLSLTIPLARKFEEPDPQTLARCVHPIVSRIVSDLKQNNANGSRCSTKLVFCECKSVFTAIINPRAKLAAKEGSSFDISHS